MWIDYNKIIDESKYNFIHSIYVNIKFYLFEQGIVDENMTKRVFIDVLKFAVNSGMAKIRFRNDQPEYLKDLLLSDQLDYLYSTFPVEYDENDPEKDIENLWWYIGCPVDIEWKLDDGSYYLSD